MATDIGAPCLGNRFLVDLGDGSDPGGSAGGFSEVVFPRMEAERGAADEHDPPRLILRRAVSGALNLHAWWQRANKGKAPRRRRVQVTLLAADGHTPVLTWRFHEARPLALHYSPLDAVHGGLVIETLEIAFDRFEMA
jgi:phage tail-like protein